MYRFALWRGTIRSVPPQHRRPRTKHEVKAIAIQDDHELTQFGTRAADMTTATFRSALRPGETEMSLLLSRLEPLASELLVRKYVSGTAVARYAVTGRLREAGFKVEHTPSSMNPLHVSVFAAADWDSDTASLFDSCFTVQHGEGNA